MTDSNALRPNIVLINCDDLGYGDLGCYGSTLHRTPAIDRLATEGMKFTNFYMASPVCSPSRGAMMTGCYPTRMGITKVLFPGEEIGIGNDEITMADILQKSGYATKLIGKWHCGDQPDFLPTNHGFDSYYGLPYSNDMGRQAEMPRAYPPLPLLRDADVIQQQPDQATLTERYTEDAVRFIRANHKQPFFLYFAHMHVHLPHYVPQRFLDKSQNGAYGAAVEYIDWSVSVVMHELARLGLNDNTLVIFTSDNGSNTRYGGSNAPLRGRKGSTWEGGMRVPCLVRWPEKVSKGQNCSQVATAMDLMPTFAGLVGADVPDDRIIDGKDISALMRGDANAQSPHDEFFYYGANRLEAVRSGKWKLHAAKGDDPIQELYDLESDIAESHNVFDDNLDVVRKLEDKLNACRRDLGDSITGEKGENCRPVGRVDNPETLTEYDENHPYIIAEYDLAEHG